MHSLNQTENFNGSMNCGLILVLIVGSKIYLSGLNGTGTCTLLIGLLIHCKGLFITIRPDHWSWAILNQWDMLSLEHPYGNILEKICRPVIMIFLRLSLAVFTWAKFFSGCLKIFWMIEAMEEKGLAKSCLHLWSIQVVVYHVWCMVRWMNYI